MVNDFYTDVIKFNRRRVVAFYCDECNKKIEEHTIYDDEYVEDIYLNIKAKHTVRILYGGLWFNSPEIYCIKCLEKGPAKYGKIIKDLGFN